MHETPKQKKEYGICRKVATIKVALYRVAQAAAFSL